MSELGIDSKGNPILLEVIVQTPTESGNPHHSTATGRFGTGGKGGPGTKDKIAPQGTQVTPEETARRDDAVRDAAREFEDFSGQDITEWLRGRITRGLSEGEVEAFRAAVRAQQITDLVDVLDQNERGKLRTRRHVRVIAPRNYTRKTLGGLTDGELRTLVSRLRAKGWNDKQVKSLQSRLPEQRRGALD